MNSLCPDPMSCKKPNQAKINPYQHCVGICNTFPVSWVPVSILNLPCYRFSRPNDDILQTNQPNRSHANDFHGNVHLL